MDDLYYNDDPGIDARHIYRQMGFSEKTFGPGDRTAGVIDHIRKELEELEENPGDVYEWADIIILAIDGAWRVGNTPEDIIYAVKQKQYMNEQRDWPDWRAAEPGKAIEHIKEKCVPVPHRWCHTHNKPLIEMQERCHHGMA